MTQAGEMERAWVLGATAWGAILALLGARGLSHAFERPPQAVDGRRAPVGGGGEGADSHARRFRREIMVDLPPQG